MTVLHLTVANDDILRWTACIATLTALAAVVVAGRLDGNTVVASIKIAVFDKYTVTRLWVTTVTIGTVIVDLDATNCDVCRQQWMDDPERRAQQSDVLDENALALVEVDHLRAQSVLRTKATLIHVDAVLGSLQQAGTAAVPLVNGHPFLEAELRGADPWPPSLARTTTIDGTATCDGHVFLLVGVNQW